MSMRNTNMLVGNGSLDQTGSATRADGYQGFADGMQTVAFQVKNFRGRIFVDASVSDNPTDSDWFPIGLSNLSYYDFDDSVGATRIETFNIVGNFVYLRARIQRSHLGLPVTDLGNCERVVLSL